MSERGSFITEFIYCHACLDAVRAALLSAKEFVYQHQLCIEGHLLPIVAGRIRGAYSGQELVDFEFVCMPELEQRLCHPVRFAVFSDAGGQAMYLVVPGGQSQVIASQGVGGWTDRDP